jgi:hypothetical protein
LSLVAARQGRLPAFQVIGEMRMSVMMLPMAKQVATTKDMAP